MEFLIGLSPGENSFCDDSIKLSSCNLQSQIDGPLHYFHANGLYVAITTHTPLPIEYTSVFWDGFGVIGNKAFSTSKPNPSAIHEIEKYLTKQADPKSAGVFCILSINPENEKITLKLDPLSQYSVFMYRHNGHFVLSNNIFLMEEYCQKSKIPLTRTLRSTAFEAGLGFGAWNNTGFNEISTLSVGHQVQCAGGDIRVTSDNHETFSADTTQEYPELLKNAADDLQNYLRAWREHLKGDVVVFDVTGGIDSRLTLAAALSIGWDDIGVFCTPDKSDDHLVSNMICNRYDLPFANFPQNFDGEALSHLDLVKRAAFRQQGYSTIYNFELGKVRIKNVARIRGGYGEITRSFFNAALTKTSPFTEVSRNVHRALNADPIFWGGFKSGTFAHRRGLAAGRLANRIRGQQQYFTQEFRAGIAPTILGQFKELQAIGAVDNYLVDGYYLADRARRHFGYTAQQLNRVRPSIEPLCLPAIWKAAKALDKAARSKATLAYDLFEALGQQELRDMPYQAASWPKNTKMNYYCQQRNKVNFVPLRERAIRDVADPAIMPTPSQKGLTGHAQYIAPLMEYFQELAGSYASHHSCWEYINKEHLYKELQTIRLEVTSSRKAGLLMRLLHGFVWYARGESAASINETLPPVQGFNS